MSPLHKRAWRNKLWPNKISIGFAVDVYFICIAWIFQLHSNSTTFRTLTVTVGETWVSVRIIFWIYLLPIQPLAIRPGLVHVEAHDDAFRRDFPVHRRDRPVPGAAVRTAGNAELFLGLYGYVDVNPGLHVQALVSRGGTAGIPVRSAEIRWWDS